MQRGMAASAGVCKRSRLPIFPARSSGTPKSQGQMCQGRRSLNDSFRKIQILLSERTDLTPTSAFFVLRVSAHCPLQDECILIQEEELEDHKRNLAGFMDLAIHSMNSKHLYHQRCSVTMSAVALGTSGKRSLTGQ